MIKIRNQKFLWVGIGAEYKQSSAILRKIVQVENWKQVTFLDSRPYPKDRQNELPSQSNFHVGDFFDYNTPVDLIYMDRIYFCVQEDLQDFIKNKMKKKAGAGTDEYFSPRLLHLKTRSEAVLRWAAHCALLNPRWVVSRGSRKEIIPPMEAFGYEKIYDTHIQGQRIVVSEYKT
jgi:hypothetical protein